MAGPGLIGGVNLVGGLIAQGEQIQDRMADLFDAAARRKAGAAMAAGRTREAAAMLGERGMLRETDALMGQATTQDALTAMSSGDYGAAREVAARGGDTGLYGAAMGAEERERAERLAFMGNAADALGQIKGADEAATVAARQEAFRQYIAPTLKAMGGLDDAQIEQMAAAQMTDQGLSAFKASLGQLEAMDIQTDPATGDIYGVDKRTGKVVDLRKGTPKPVALARGSRLVDPQTGQVIAEGGDDEGRWVERSLPDGSTEWFQLPASGSGPVGSRSAGATTPPASGPVYSRVAEVAAKAGAEAGEVAYLQRLAQVESNGNPNARNGSSTGLFQFQPDTFNAVGGGNIASVDDQTKAALALRRRDAAALQQLGIEPDDANLYIMHQQGAGGGRALLTAPPEVNAVAALTPVYGDAKRARQAIVGNGGQADMTAGEFVDYWRNRWSGGRAIGARASAPSTVPGSAPKPEKEGINRKAEADLRKEFNALQEVKDYRNVSAAYRNVQAAARNPSAAGDLSMIFAYMKLLDPTSVVREQEFANAQNAAGVPDQVRNAYNRALSGQRLNPNQRADFINQASGIFTTRKERFDAIAADYRGYAEDYGIDPDRVVSTGPAPSTTPAPKSGNPTAGMTPEQIRVRAGYKGVKAAPGTFQNPLIPTSKAQYDALKPGTHYIDTDGKIMVKR